MMTYLEHTLMSDTLYILLPCSNDDVGVAVLASVRCPTTGPVRPPPAVLAATPTAHLADLRLHQGQGHIIAAEHAVTVDTAAGAAVVPAVMVAIDGENMGNSQLS